MVQSPGFADLGRRNMRIASVPLWYTRRAENGAQITVRKNTHIRPIKGACQFFKAG
jgi:hypothetical protein